MPPSELHDEDVDDDIDDGNDDDDDVSLYSFLLFIVKYGRLSCINKIGHKLRPTSSVRVTYPTQFTI